MAAATILRFDMAFSDPIVLQAIRELTHENPDREITYADIAERAGCSESTVLRAMKRLCLKHITREGGRHIGYRYKFVTEEKKPTMRGA